MTLRKGGQASQAGRRTFFSFVQLQTLFLTGSVLVTLMAGDHTVLPYINLGYAMVYFASDGQLFSHAQARGPLMVESLIRMLAIEASVPIWQVLGLL